MTTTDVLAYLMSKGISPKRVGAREANFSCFFCGEDVGSRGRLYINIDPTADIPSLFECKLCGAHGAMPTIMRHFGDVTEQEERSDDSYLRRAILAEAATFYHEALNAEALRWFKSERGLTLDTIIEHQLGYAGGGLYAHLREREFKTADMMATGLVADDRSGRIGDFLTNHVTIPYIVSGNVVMIRGRDLAGGERKYLTPHGQKTRLFNSDVVWEADEVCVVEGEMDCLIVEQLGFKAVAVPGANTWQDSWDAYFLDARRCYVVFDPDEAGAKGAAKVAARLGPKARVVMMPDQCDISDWVRQGNGAAEFRELLRSGSGGLLITVDEAIREHTEVQGQVGLKFGIGRLDSLLDPGLLPAQVAIVLASSGSGKTILLLNLFSRLCSLQPDVRVLFVSLEQTRGDWWERARRIYRFFNLGASDEDAMNFWRERLLIVDRNRLTTDQLLIAIDDYRSEMGRLDLVAIDYLGYWAQSFKGERYERTSDAVMSLKEIAKEARVAVIAPHQVNRSIMQGTEPSADSARDSGVVLETADFLFSLWSMDNQQGRSLEEWTGEIFLKLLKSRHGGVGHKEAMYFAPLSLAMVPADEFIRSQLARNELVYRSRYKSTWEEALVRHEAGSHVDEINFSKVQRKLWEKRQTSFALAPPSPSSALVPLRVMR